MEVGCSVSWKEFDCRRLWLFDSVVALFGEVLFALHGSAYYSASSGLGKML